VVGSLGDEFLAGSRQSYPKKEPMMKKWISMTLLLLIFAVPAGADDMGLWPRETYDRVQERGDEILFLDVRDPVEIMFIGFTDEVDANIPFLIIDRTRWDGEKNRFQPYQNPDFAAEVEAALAARGLGKDAEVITMCRSGSERGKPSAQFLRDNGFPNARYVINGFQGGRIKEGDRAGFRLKNGWQNSGLPWSPKMNPEKMYRTDRAPAAEEAGGG
jgi:rhodanese-related sulfurtransferase